MLEQIQDWINNNGWLCVALAAWTAAGIQILRSGGSKALIDASVTAALDQKQAEENEDDDKPMTPAEKIADRIDDAVRLGCSQWAVKEVPDTHVDNRGRVAVKKLVFLCVNPQFSQISVQYNENATYPARQFVYTIAGNDVTQYVPESQDGEFHELKKEKAERDEKDRLEYILSVADGGALTSPPIAAADQPTLDATRLFNAFKEALTAGSSHWILCDDITYMQFKDTSMQVRFCGAQRADAWIGKTWVTPQMTREQQAELARLVSLKWQHFKDVQTKMTTLVNLADTVVASLPKWKNGGEC